MLYEHADIGGPAKEPVASLALGWKLTDDQSRRVDAVRVEPTIYRACQPPPLASRRASAPSELTAIEGRPAAGSLRARRQQRSLSVSVPEDMAPVVSKRTHSVSPSGQASPSTTSPSSLALRRKAKSLRLDLSGLKEPAAGFSGPGAPRREPSPLRTPLLADVAGDAGPDTPQSDIMDGAGEIEGEPPPVL